MTVLGHLTMSGQCRTRCLSTAPPVEMAAQHAENKARSSPKAAHLGRALLMAPCVRVFRSVRHVAKADRYGKANRDYYRYS